MIEIYGASDDLIEIEGDIREEFNGDDGLIVCSDGTVLSIHYGKQDLGIWDIQVVREGELFTDIQRCNDEEADRFSDTVTLEEGIEWVYFCTDRTKVSV